MEGPELWRELGQQLRVDSIRAAAVTKSGHPTSSMSAADLMAVLLAKYLRYDFDRPDDPRNDHLIFSKRSEEHTSELQSRRDLVCRLLLEKKKKPSKRSPSIRQEGAISALGSR